MFSPLPSLLWNLFFLVICGDEAYSHWREKHYVQAALYLLLILLWLLAAVELLGFLAKEPVF